MASRAGYEDMSRVTAINKKTVRVTFKKLYAGWRDLFSGPYGIFPAHALTGQDFNKVWQNDLNNPKTGKPIASGPFYVQSYQRGSQLTLVRNPLYWGKHKAYLNRVIFRFLTSQTTEAQQVRGGEVDAIYPQPNAALIPLRTDRNLVYKVGLGTVWEHLDFQVGPKGHPALKVPAVRKAVAQGIDRSAIIKRLFGEVTGNLATLQNAVYVTNSKYYQPHYNIWKYAPAKSRALLDGLNCTRGGDGIYTCPSVGKLSFSFKTTAGNTRRLNAFTIMQAQLKDVGIQINYEPYPAAVVFGDQHISGHNYDLAYFAWVGTPDPTGYVEIGSCGGSQNYQTYCSRKATALLLKARTILDPDEQAKVFNQADKILANGLPTLPMYQLPDVLIYNKAKVRGMVLNDTQEGPSWNIEDWWVTR
jgi:peptide/nickel transport system substrate-binding protein